MRYPKSELNIEKDLQNAGILDLAREAGIPISSPIDKAAEKIITVDPDIIAAKNKAIKFSPHAIPVLITGETGTGKELFAKLLHGNRIGNFVAVNCGGIPDTLIEAEFFGAEKGAYTGCNITRRGYFEEAHNGTIFLDEIAELDRSLQSKLLRVLQEKVVRRLGSAEEIPINCRIISATNQNLEDLKNNNKIFRTDLFYRLAGVEIHLKPLRDRWHSNINTNHSTVDIIYDDNIIAQKLLPGLSLKEYKATHPLKFWPGNVRELLNYIEEQRILNLK